MTTTENLRENVAIAEKLLSRLRISLAQDGVCEKNLVILNEAVANMKILAGQYKELSKPRK